MNRKKPAPNISPSFNVNWPLSPNSELPAWIFGPNIYQNLLKGKIGLGPGSLSYGKSVRRNQVKQSYVEKAGSEYRPIFKEAADKDIQQPVWGGTWREAPYISRDVSNIQTRITAPAVLRPETPETKLPTFGEAPQGGTLIDQATLEKLFEMFDLTPTTTTPAEGQEGIGAEQPTEGVEGGEKPGETGTNQETTPATETKPPTAGPSPSQNRPDSAVTTSNTPSPSRPATPSSSVSNTSTPSMPKTPSVSTSTTMSPSAPAKSTANVSAPTPTTSPPPSLTRKSGFVLKACASYLSKSSNIKFAQGNMDTPGGQITSISDSSSGKTFPMPPKPLEYGPSEKDFGFNQTSTTTVSGPSLPRYRVGNFNVQMEPPDFTTEESFVRAFGEHGVNFFNRLKNLESKGYRPTSNLTNYLEKAYAARQALSQMYESGGRVGSPYAAYRMQNLANRYRTLADKETEMVERGLNYLEGTFGQKLKRQGINLENISPEEKQKYLVAAMAAERLNRQLDAYREGKHTFAPNTQLNNPEAFRQTQINNYLQSAARMAGVRLSGEDQERLSRLVLQDIQGKLPVSRQNVRGQQR